MTVKIIPGLLFPFMMVLLSVLGKPEPEQAFVRPRKVEQYIKKYRYLTVELNEMTGIPTSIIIAVAGLESDWGTSDLARQANNHFGIKAQPGWQGATHCKSSTEYIDGFPVQEWECFRKYSLIRSSYEDFGQFILTRPNYRNLQYYPKWDSWSWAMGLQAGGYATDPKYAEKLMAAIKAYHLNEL